MSGGHTQMAELRVSIYGRRKDEWIKLAKWICCNKLYSENNRWMVQVPLCFSIEYQNVCVYLYINIHIYMYIGICIYTHTVLGKQQTDGAGATLSVDRMSEYMCIFMYKHTYIYICTYCTRKTADGASLFLDRVSEYMCIFIYKHTYM